MNPTPRLPHEGVRSRRIYTVTLQIAVESDADLADPFARVAVFHALVDQLTTAAALGLDTPFGGASARVGLVTAIA